LWRAERLFGQLGHGHTKLVKLELPGSGVEYEPAKYTSVNAVVRALAAQALPDP
jgi:hypothetical protein